MRVCAPSLVGLLMIGNAAEFTAGGAHVQANVTAPYVY
jgi:hypothetical protein